MPRHYDSRLYTNQYLIGHILYVLREEIALSQLCSEQTLFNGSANASNIGRVMVLACLFLADRVHFFFLPYTFILVLSLILRHLHIAYAQS